MMITIDCQPKHKDLRYVYGENDQVIGAFGPFKFETIRTNKSIVTIVSADTYKVNDKGQLELIK